MNLESYSLPEAKYAKFALETDKPFEMYMGNSPEGTIARDYNGEHHDHLYRIWKDTIVPFANKASYKALRSDLAKAMCTPLPSRQNKKRKRETLETLQPRKSISDETLQAIRKIVGVNISMEDAIKLQYI